jgi:CubicO group peptidase (beta-lactamase class C family)
MGQIKTLSKDQRKRSLGIIVPILLALTLLWPLTAIAKSFTHVDSQHDFLELDESLLNEARHKLASHRNPCGAPCADPARAEKDILAIAKQAMQQYDLKSVILRVLVGRRNLVTVALGESLTGVPAKVRMHWRNGAIAISYLATVLLQLQDEKRLSLDDRLSLWFPALPQSHQVTLRMLANSTSGYPDYVTNEGFLNAFYANVFRQWSQKELLDIAFSQPMVCEPGTCFSYAPTNFVLLGKVLSEVTGKPVETLIRNRILRPLGMRNTESQDTPVIQTPALHAFTDEREIYEDSSFWNPSWTLAEGAIMTTNIVDAARAARAIGTGRLVSREAYQQQIAPLTAGLPPLTLEGYYGLGVVVLKGWILQNPRFHGYSAVASYLPSRELTVAVTATNGLTAGLDVNYSEMLFKLIGNYLVPDRPFPIGP